MALSGTFYGTTNNEYIQPKIVWSGTQSINGNYTDVTVTLYYSRTNTGYTTSGTLTGAVTINGTSTSYSKYVQLTYNSNTAVCTATTRVYHNTDGTKTITISASGAISGASLSSTSISASVTLDTIPRATTPTFSASSVDIGGAVSITVDGASSSFTHTLTYAFGSANGTIVQGLKTSILWEIPLSLANQIPNGTSGTCTVTCKTYNGSTLIGTKTATLTLTVPSSVVPSIDSVSITEATAGIAEKFNAFVQNKSTLAIAITASGAYASTIKNYETYIQAVSYSNASFISALITTSGTISVITTVTDSRGRTAQVTNQITVLEYSAPVINSFSAFRIDTSGNASEDGNRIAMAMNFAIASVNGLNDRTYKFEYRKTTDTEFTTFGSGTASTTYDDTQYFTSSPEISTDYAYIIRLEIADFFETAVYDFEVPTAFTIMDFRNTGKGMAIGKVSEKDSLEVAMDSEFTGQVKIFAPDSDVADSGFLRLYRDDGTLAAFLATSDDGNGLNLHFYENGTWTSVVKIQSDGTLAPNAVPITDYVVEHGTSGIWTYRKWNSGIAECWGNIAVSNVACTISVGGWYRTEVISPGSYPIQFTSTPTVQANFSANNSGTGGFTWDLGATEPLTTANIFYIMRMSSVSAMNGIIHYYALGKWK